MKQSWLERNQYLEAAHFSIYLHHWKQAEAAAQCCEPDWESTCCSIILVQHVVNNPALCYLLYITNFAGVLTLFSSKKHYCWVFQMYFFGSSEHHNQRTIQSHYVGEKAEISLLIYITFTFTQVLNFSINLRYTYVTWVFFFCATFYFYSTTCQREMYQKSTFYYLLLCDILSYFTNF